MKPLITIFTPAYNRAYTIHKCYESLKRQTCKDFKWLVIDDGSTDNTKELIQTWINEKNDFEISYIYQENQGMHGAHNTAYESIDTELNICIDSDDYMPDNAIENIFEAWKYVKNNKNIAGLVGLDSYESGKIIGTKIPETIETSTLFDLYHRYGVTGDKKLVYRTELTKKYPYPIFEGEKYVGLAYKYYKIDEKYNLAIINKILCVVEYMEDGSSKNMLSQYRNNPKGWSFYRLENLKRKNTKFSYKVKECIHYVSSSIICKNRNFIKQSPRKIITLCILPLGFLLSIYIKHKTSEVFKYGGN